jgi:hypothetical protein
LDCADLVGRLPRELRHLDEKSFIHADRWLLEQHKVSSIKLNSDKSKKKNFNVSSRGSMFFISRMDGVMDAWDLLQQQNEPVLAVKVCDEPLQCIRNHEGGKLIGAGSAKGIIYLLEVSDNMAISAKNDKPLLTAVSCVCFTYLPFKLNEPFSRCSNVKVAVNEF